MVINRCLKLLVEGDSCGHGSFFLLCVSARACVCVCVCGPVYALVYPIVMGRSSCCVVCLLRVASKAAKSVPFPKKWCETGCYNTISREVHLLLAPLPMNTAHAVMYSASFQTRYSITCEHYIVMHLQTHLACRDKKMLSYVCISVSLPGVL
jgi:hypothetical protein